MSAPSRPVAPVIDHSAVAERVNTGTSFAMFSVFRVAAPLPADAAARAALSDDAERALGEIAGLSIRGWYDVAGLRADADVMVWWWAERIETVQQAYQVLRQSALGAHLEPVWSQAATHRPAEFNRGHVPAFLAGDAARGYACVYPFVRSYDWYLLPDAERAAMLRDHGMAARSYGDVLGNTLTSFALGDYEWILAFEADDLTRIVDLMRDLRATEARRHVREEVPFYTGPRAELAALVERMPRSR